MHFCPSCNIVTKLPARFKVYLEPFRTGTLASSHVHAGQCIVMTEAACCSWLAGHGCDGCCRASIFPSASAPQVAPSHKTLGANAQDIKDTTEPQAYQPFALLIMVSKFTPHLAFRVP